MSTLTLNVNGIDRSVVVSDRSMPLLWVLIDIGSNTPAAIAVSVAAEIQAALNHRSGGMLKFRSGTIHAPVPEGGTPWRRW